MLDLKSIREKPDYIEKLLQRKDPSISLKEILSLDEEHRTLKAQVEQRKNVRNQHAKRVGEQKQKGEDIADLLREISSLGGEISSLDKELKEIEQRLEEKLSFLPNVPKEEVKASLDPKENVCLEAVGTPPSFSFKPKNHLQLNDQLDLFDFKRGAKISGSGWVAYRGVGARLERALIQLMLDIHLASGFELWIPPLAVRESVAHASAHLPKFADQLYRIPEEEHPLYLIPTAEAALNGLHLGEILSKEELPLRYVAYTPCFRREAGAAGSQERGLIRTHQFNKVELFCFTKPSESDFLLEEMVTQAEKILQLLHLPYRKMLLVTGDTSFAAAKTIDLEVWLPGQERYYEVSSLSNCTDFQARRSRIRFKGEDGKNQFVHTLNGSGLATSRLMVALLETHQNKEGAILLPEALIPYMGGMTTLQPNAQR